MKILILSTSDILGGASQVANTLGKELINRGHEVDMWVGKKSSDYSWVNQIEGIGSVLKPLTERLIHRVGISQLSLNSNFPFAWKRSLQKYDIVHLHDLPTGFNWAALSWLSHVVPTIWTVHSMMPITGGCVFSMECDKWKAKCGECPQFGKWPLHWLHRDASRAQLLLKRFVYKRSSLCFIFPSEWLLKCAKHKTIIDKPMCYIPNAPDESYFYYEDKIKARKALGIPIDKFVIMFSISGNNQDKRKGIDVILKSLKALKSDTVYLLPTGITPLDEETQLIFNSFSGKQAALIKERDLLRKYYCASDVFWSPTRADNCPMGILEAMACGTTVIANDVGGVREIIEDNINGYLVKNNNFMEFVNYTDFLRLNPGKLSLMCQNSIKKIAANFNMDSFIDRHLNIYKKRVTISY